MMFHPRSRLSLGLRVMLWSLPLHLRMVGLNPLRRLHLSLRASLLLLPLHLDSTTWYLPRLWIHPSCLAGPKSARGNSCAAENLAQYVSKHAVDMHPKSPTTAISLHRTFTTAAKHATEPPALRPMKLLHQRSLQETLLRTTTIPGIIHLTLQGRGSSRPRGPPAVGNGTRGRASGSGTDCIPDASEVGGLTF